MCGITGWINLENDISAEYPVIEGMSRSLGHRGPDAEGSWTSPHALIAHKRLTVIDPAGGAQPMVRSRGDSNYVITYNGELYNTSDLRCELESRGHRFLSSSDTEVLLVSYIEWGPDCVERLNGIYAFGIWSEKDSSLFLARDRFGVKPLFYTVRDGSLLFASELKALLAHPSVKPEVGTEGLAEVFAMGPARTPGIGVFRNVYELKPAHCLLFDRLGLKVRRYWQLVSQPHEDGTALTLEKIRELVVDSIRRQFVSDVPVCTFLSGGLDSSVITALAAGHFKSFGSVLHTYSIDYRDNGEYFTPSLYQPDSDAPWIKRMSDEFGTYHHYTTVDTDQITDALEMAVEARDLPGMADIDSSLWLFCREVKKGATVSLSGECADEVFGGYPWFHAENLMNAGTFPWAVNQDIRSRIMSDDLIEAVKPSEYCAARYANTLDEVPRLSDESPVESRRRELFYLNFAWFMQTLLERKDRMSMAHGLEVRVPYCDHRLVQYVWNIPWDLKMYAGREKGLLRKALEGLLPDDVLYRKKSPYPKTHNPSYEKTVRQRLLEILHDPTSPLVPLVDKPSLLSIMNEKSDYGRPWFGQLMALPQLYAWLVQIDHWLRRYKVSLV